MVFTDHESNFVLINWKHPAISVGALGSKEEKHASCHGSGNMWHTGWIFVYFPLASFKKWFRTTQKNKKKQKTWKLRFIISQRYHIQLQRYYGIRFFYNSVT